MTSADDLTVADQLVSLGADPLILSDAQRNRLDMDGFLVFPSVLSEDKVVALRTVYERLLVEEGDQAGLEVHQEPGTARLSDLVNKDPAFDECWSHPLQLAAVSHVLGAPFKLSSLNGRSALPGRGLQNLHVDWDRPPEAGDYQVCNSFWMLDDFTPENGATRVVPASHRCGKVPHEVMPDATATHPDEHLITGTAGSLAVVNSHLWHGGTMNITERPRRALHGYFTRRCHPQQTVQRDYIRPDVRARLSPAHQHLLDL